MKTLFGHEREWRDLTVRRACVWGLFAGFIPLTLLMNGILSGPAFNTFMFCFVVAWFVSGIRLSLYSCPVCGHLFHTKFFVSNAFAIRCLHCRSRRGDERSPPEEDRV